MLPPGLRIRWQLHEPHAHEGQVGGKSLLVNHPRCLYHGESARLEVLDVSQPVGIQVLCRPDVVVIEAGGSCGPGRLEGAP